MLINVLSIKVRKKGKDNSKIKRTEESNKKKIKKFPLLRI